MSGHSPVFLFDKPFVLSMGPQRTGSSWIDRYLRWRGDVCLPDDVKEIFFFDRHYQRGADFYKSHFNPQDNHKIVMEVSTTAFDHIDAPMRVENLCGKDLKMICPLRHPVARSYSLYKHYKRYGIVGGSLKEAVDQAPQILFSSRYADHLERWFETFDPAQITVLFNEDLEENTTNFIESLCSALGLDMMMPGNELLGPYNVSAEAPHDGVAKIANNVCHFLRDHKMHGVINTARKIGFKDFCFGSEDADNKQQITDEDQKWLEDRLLGEVDKLEKLLGYQIASWHK